MLDLSGQNSDLFFIIEVKNNSDEGALRREFATKCGGKIMSEQDMKAAAAKAHLNTFKFDLNSDALETLCQVAGCTTEIVEIPRDWCESAKAMLVHEITLSAGEYHTYEDVADLAMQF